MAPAMCLGPAQEPEDQPEEGAGGEAVRRDQEGVQRGARAGDVGAPSQGEDDFRVSLL